MQSDYDIAKLPPQAIEVERSLLGLLLIDGEAIATLGTSLKPEHFYKEAHAEIFRAVLKASDRGEGVDVLTVYDVLMRSNASEKCGGYNYLIDLTGSPGGAERIGDYIDILHDAFIKRQLIKISSELINLSFDPATDAEQALTTANKHIDALNEQSDISDRMAHISRALKDATHEAGQRELRAKSGKATGITTGLSELDKNTGGWQKGELVILAGRPSMGKTAVMLHLAKSAAKQGHPVCLYSLEMSEISLANRLMLSESEISPENFKSGFLSQHDWLEIERVNVSLSGLPLYVDDNALVSMRYIKAHSRLMKRRGLCDIVFIDYLQLADMRTDERNRNREQEVAQATRQAKIIAKELQIPVILLSQLSRKVEDRKDSKPSLSDLRESGAIEQDADIVAFVYREEYYNPDTVNKGVGELLIRKNRNGSIGDLRFGYNESLTKIVDYSDEPGFLF